mgnify:CR=1
EKLKNLLLDIYYDLMSNPLISIIIRIVFVCFILILIAYFLFYAILFGVILIQYIIFGNTLIQNKLEKLSSES